MSEKAKAVIEALGGADNIRELDSCITRLRLVLADPKKVDEPALRRQGAMGVVRLGGGAVQVVFGTSAEHLEAEIKELLGRG